MDAQRFATCINPKVKDAVLQREKAANAEPAPAAFRGHFPPQIATRGFVQTKKTESMNMKLKTASKDGDFSGIPAALAQTATQLDGVKAGVWYVW